MKLLKWVLLTLAILAGVISLYLSWAFWEPHNFTEDSTAYHLKLSDEVKKFPLWEPSENPLYHIRMGDGPSRPTSTVHYSSKLTQPDLVNKLKSLNFTCKRQENRLQICKTDIEDKYYSIDIWVHGPDNTGLTPIEVTFIGL